MSNYRSLLSPYIEKFLEYREALFHTNSSYSPVLQNLDSFCLAQYPHESSLKKEMVLGWLEKSHNQGGISRGSVVRKFAVYMNGIGGTAYVLLDKMYSGKSVFVPYVFQTANSHICFLKLIESNRQQKIHSLLRHCQYCSS